jgi:type IV pilus assembly protein PilN
MAKINLLPWRAERRKNKQKEFGLMLGMAALAAVGLSVLGLLFYNARISAQQRNNDYLTNEITEIEKKIVEIEGLDKKKADLLSRKKAIECLQGRRSLMVHLFDDLVRTIPDGVKLNSITQDGSKLTVNGSSQSNARVSAYMRNLQVSGWMSQPDLTIIEAKGADKGLPYQFSLITTIRNPNTVTDEAGEGAESAEVATATPAAAATPAPATGQATAADSAVEETDECDLDATADAAASEGAKK